MQTVNNIVNIKGEKYIGWKHQRNHYYTGVIGQKCEDFQHITSDVTYVLITVIAFGINFIH